MKRITSQNSRNQSSGKTASDQRASGKRASVKSQRQAPTQAIIGRTICGVISKPVAGGGETLVMLQFSDGSCFEFMSPRSAKVLDQITQMARPVPVDDPAADTQLSMFPQDGTIAATHLAA